MIVAGILIIGVAAVQLSLVLGLLHGGATFSGAAPTHNGVLTFEFGIIAGINAVILLVFTWIVLARFGL